jgi:HTH-type transcriptional regulator, quorum sensing regulator NprR
MEGSVLIFGREFELDFVSGWIKYNRLQRQYSLEALAHGICSTSHLSYFENGKKKLRGEIIEALLKKLNIHHIKELSDIGFIRQKFYNMMFQIETLNYEGAKLTYNELLGVKELIETSPYNIEYKIYELMYKTFVEELNYDSLETDIHNLDKIYSTLKKDLQHLYLFTSGKIIYQFKNHNEGIKRLEAAQKIKETPWTNYYLGYSCCFHNEYLKAVYLLEKSLESYEKSSRYINAIWCHNYLGICYSALNIYEKAHEHFKAALTGAEHFNIEKIYWHLYTNLSNLYLITENYKECIEVLELALRTDGDPVVPAANYIEVCAKTNNLEKCKEIFNIYLTEEHKDSKYYYYLYFLYLGIFKFNDEIFYKDVTEKILPFYENMNYIEICRAVKVKLIEYLENKRKYKDANKIYKELIM